MGKKTKKSGNNSNLVDVRQVEFLEQYIKCNFNITRTCHVLEIARGTFYHWLNTDKDFAKQFRDANTFVTDLITSAFIEGITDENPAIRAKYLAIIPQRILLQAFGDNSEVTSIAIENITLG